MNTRAMTAIENGLLRWVEAMRTHPRMAVGSCVALAFLGLYLAISTLKVNTDASEMIDPRLPYRQAMIEFDDAFPQMGQNILVLVRAQTPDMADAFTGALARRLEAIPEYVSSAYAPSASPFFERNGLLFLSYEDLSDQLLRITKAGPLIETLNANPSLEGLFGSLTRSADLLSDAEGFEGGLDPAYDELAATIEARLKGDPRPFSWQALFQKTATAPGPDGFYQRVITVTPVLNFTSLHPAREAADAIRREVKALQAEGGWDKVEVGLTGNPVLRTEELRSVSSGIGLSMTISLVCVGILLWLVFRSGSMAAVSVFTLITTLLITAGFAALAIGALNLVSIAFTVLLIGLGVDYAIHFALHVIETRRHGMALPQTLDTTIHEVGGALALSAPTTALAFFAFVPTKFDGMAQLGIISGAGVIIAFFVAITIIPAMASLLPPPKDRKLTLASPSWARITGGRNGRIIAAGVILAFVGSLFLLPQVRFDADPMELRNPESPSVLAFNQLFNDENTVPYRLNLIAEDKDQAAISAEKLKAAPEVGRVISILDFVPKEQDAKLRLIQQASFTLGFALEETSGSRPVPELGPNMTALMGELAAEPDGSPGARLLSALRAFDTARQSDPSLSDGLQGDVFRFWPYQIERLRTQLEGAGPVSLETLPQELTSRFLTEDGRARVEIVPAGNLDMRKVDHRRQFVEMVSALEPRATGSALNLLRAGDVVSNAMLTASLIAGGVVLVLLWILLRQVTMVLLIMLPVVLAAVLTSAIGVLIDMPYNFANVIVIPLLIGLGADNGIHLAMRSAKMARHGAVFGTTTPRAVFFSALTTIASFGSLILSEHRGTASMGMLLTIALSVTLFATLVVLPAAMDAVDRRWPLRKF